MKKLVLTGALALVGTMLLPMPMASADQTCHEGDELSFINPPPPENPNLRQPLLKHDDDGDRYICLHPILKKNGDTRLTYHDDL